MANWQIIFTFNINVMTSCYANIKIILIPALLIHNIAAENIAKA